MLKLISNSPIGSKTRKFTFKKVSENIKYGNALIYGNQ